MTSSKSTFSRGQLAFEKEDDWIALLEFLGATVGDFLEADDVESLARLLDDTLEKIITVQYPGLYLYDEDEETLKLVWSQGFTDEEVRLAEETADERHPGWVVRNAEGFYVPDVDNDPENRTQDTPRTARVRSRLYHPIVSLGECVGALAFAATETDAFDREHISTLGFFSHLVGAAYGRIRRERQIKNSRRRFERLANVFHRLGPNPETNIEILVEEARTLFDAAFSLYRRHQEADDTLVTVAGEGLPGELPHSEAAANRICYERTMQVSGETTAVEVLADSEWRAFGEGYESYLGTSVEVRERSAGALCIVSESERRYSDVDRHILSTLGKAISLEEERSEANRRVERLNETLRAIREVGQLIVRERDRGRILKSTCELLVDTRAYKYAFFLGRNESEGIEIEASAPESASQDLIQELLRREPLDSHLADALSGRSSYFNHLSDEPLSVQPSPSGEAVTRIVGMTVEYAGIVYGVLVLGSSVSDADSQEQTLLQGVANDVAFVSHMLTRDSDTHQLADQALRDWLTELPNRALFRSRLKQALARAERHGESFALILLDLDNLKEVNDSLGHAAGDRLLVRVAERLTRIFREYDTVARIGGDEFTIIVERTDSPELVQTLLKRIEEQLDIPFEIYGNTFHSSASMGVVDYDDLLEEYDADQIDENELLRVVDRGMYEAKERPGTRWVRPEPGELESNEEIQKSNRLRQALAEEQLLPHYQPVVDLEEEQIVGFEALARWRQADGSVRSAVEFIETADRMGRLWDVSKVIYRQAFLDLERWRRESDDELLMFLNLSPSNFDSTEMLTLFADFEVDSSEIVFEITEQALLQNPERIQALIEGGFRIAIDDFGTGYSSFEYLKRFDVDCLKVDMTFVQGAVEDSTDRSILETICDLGGKLGLLVVGEGVESPEHRRMLHEFDCECAQGHFFGHPVPGQEVERRLFGNALSTGQDQTPTES